MILQKLSDYVISQNIVFANKEIDINQLQVLILKYTQFLQAKLNIGMFVPAVKVSGKWEALEKPKDYENLIWHINRGDFDGTKKVVHEYKQYEQAEKQVLFSGFEWVGHKSDLDVEIYIGNNDPVIRIVLSIESNDLLMILPDGREIITIEDLTSLGIELTEAGQNKFK